MTFTLIDQGRASEVQASVEGGRVRLSADALRAALGWELHDGTLCNDAMCVPLPAGSRLGEGGVFDLARWRPRSTGRSPSMSTRARLPRRLRRESARRRSQA